MLLSVLTGSALQEFCSHWASRPWTAEERFHLDQFEKLVAEKRSRPVEPGLLAFDFPKDRR